MVLWFHSFVRVRVGYFISGPFHHICRPIFFAALLIDHLSWYVVDETLGRCQQIGIIVGANVFDEGYKAEAGIRANSENPLA